MESLKNSDRILTGPINKIEFDSLLAMGQLFGFSEQFTTNWGQILEANYGNFAIIKMFNPIKKTKPDSLTCVRGYRESALQR